MESGKMIKKQCYSLSQLGSNERCPNKTFGHSKHCTDHYQGALKLYLHYKNLCTRTDKLNIDKEFKMKRKQIAHLKHCQELLIEAYNARLKHRNYAFAPECYDFGHNLQFKIIQDKIDKCNEKIIKLYNENNENNLKVRADRNLYETIYLDDIDNVDNVDNIDGESKDESQNDKDDKEILRSIRRFNIQKKKDEMETNKIISMFVEANKHRFEDRKKAIIMLKKIIFGISKVGNIGSIDVIGDGDDVNSGDNDDKMINLGLLKLIQFLIFRGYFKPRFKPPRCDKCECKRYAQIQFKLFEDRKITSLDLELEQLPTNFIDFINKSVLQGLKKIVEVFKDFHLLFQLYGKSILTMDLQAGWSAELRRLVLTQAEIKSISQKKSESLALLRMTDKARRRILKQRSSHLMLRSYNGYDTDEEDDEDFDEFNEDDFVESEDDDEYYYTDDDSDSDDDEDEDDDH